MFGIRIVFALALVLALANIVATSGPTSIFIDQIDEYALLATCAELELSTIVRDMKYGCGDGGDGAFQSFTCFCYESSAKFSSMIGVHVATECPDDPSQNTTALGVFSSYCEIGGSKLHDDELLQHPYHRQHHYCHLRLLLQHRRHGQQHLPPQHRYHHLSQRKRPSRLLLLRTTARLP
ncbi:hypothetical protein CC77DRAFT_612854 [Alternaria alternata]|uniref:Extracellular membrane protein CFEM domain-containing protein n=1 Tax=Alternaria alternata TaxID=5599 RepID=A0A177DWK6_ALTAL|nr:hypothetical protein CC77DRAFT_612854 [Alternaria alternata]OAG23570.1 hypothetical protein CC77DRAFT_612854 [Alternaria alternata]